MQPPIFQFQGPAPMAPRPKKERSGLLTAMLALKGVVDAVIVVVGVLAYVALGSAADVTIPREQARHAANILLVGILVAFVELGGVVGTFSFKRWGVYIIFGFSALNVMVNLSAGNRVLAYSTLATSGLVGMMIFPRWKDYE